MPHGDHWQALGLLDERGEDGGEDAVLDLISRTISEGGIVGEAPYSTDEFERAGAVGLTEGSLEITAILGLALTGGTLLTAFPGLRGGTRHRARIQAARAWETPVEGLVTLKIGDTVLTAFAPGWAFEPEWKTTGADVNVELAMLAYTLEPVGAHEGFTIPGDEPLRVGTAGMRGFLPLDETPEDQSLTSVIESLSSADAFGLSFVRLEIALFVEEERSYSVPLVASPSVFAEGYVPKPGDAIRAVAWLQARIAR